MGARVTHETPCGEDVVGSTVVRPYRFVQVLSGGRGSFGGSFNGGDAGGIIRGVYSPVGTQGGIAWKLQVGRSMGGSGMPLPADALFREVLIWSEGAGPVPGIRPLSMSRA